MPKVSVIVPIYGVEKYIERCARSLFDQTLEDIEYIFVDDCTKDNSISVLKNVLSRYPNRIQQVKILHHEINKGVTAARLTGIIAASGKYIVHCDSDDYVDSNIYKELFEKAEREGSDLVFCDYYEVIDNNNLYFKSINTTYISKLMSDLLSCSKPGHLWNVIVKKEIVQNSSLNLPTANILEDLVLVCQYVFYSKHISYINVPLYYYIRRNDSVISIQSQKILDINNEAETNFCILEHFLKDNHLFNTYEDDLVYGRYSFKNNTLCLINSFSGCKHWINSFSCINEKLFFNKHIGILAKIKCLTIFFRIYPVIQKFI